MSKTTTPEIIYLMEEIHGEGEWVWCDDPAPGVEMREEDAVPYVRADIVMQAAGVSSLAMLKTKCEPKHKEATMKTQEPSGKKIDS